MFDFAPVLGATVDRAIRPLIRFVHETLGRSPNQVTWAACGASVVAAGIAATGRLGWALGVMAVGQVLDGLDGGIARRYGLVSAKGKQLDDRLDRASEFVIFCGFALGGFVAWKPVALALAAILLNHTITDRSKLDPGVKRFALYFGVLLPYRVIFTIIFGVNLAAYVIGLLIIDCQFQLKMDALGGDLDTVASRAAALETPPGR